MLSSDTDCDGCVSVHAEGPPSTTTVLSTLLFVSTFLLVALVVHQRVYPLLSSSENDTSSIAHSERKRSFQRIIQLTFSSTIALSAVLAQLLLCEISNSFNPVSRKISIRATVASLLCLLIVIIPLLVICTIVEAAGWKFASGKRTTTRIAWGLEVLGYAIFLTIFWLMGLLLPTASQDTGTSAMKPVPACLERLGIAGTLMMALLSGFATVSAVWQAFAAKARPATEADINRKQTGLDATRDLLAEKSIRLRQLESAVADAPEQGFFQRAMGVFRQSADIREVKTLELEISGLKTMAISLENSLSILRSRRLSQLRASTTLGRVTEAVSYLFSCYCVYRIASISINLVRRSWRSSKPSSSASIDPITHVIALFARHIYPAMNQIAWTHQISFLLSGFVLLASFNAVLQTFHLVSRIFPSALKAFQSNGPLLIAQIAGLYMISSALMLRNLMPKDVGGVINDALDTGVLHDAWTENWFEAWFMGSALLSMLGIWLSQKISGSEGAWGDDNWDMDLELGKRL